MVKMTVYSSGSLISLSRAPTEKCYTATYCGLEVVVAGWDLALERSGALLPSSRLTSDVKKMVRTDWFSSRTSQCAVKNIFVELLTLVMNTGHDNRKEGDFK